MPPVEGASWRAHLREPEEAVVGPIFGHFAREGPQRLVHADVGRGQGGPHEGAVLVVVGGAPPPTPLALGLTPPCLTHQLRRHLRDLEGRGTQASQGGGAAFPREAGNCACFPTEEEEEEEEEERLLLGLRLLQHGAIRDIARLTRKPGQTGKRTDA
eukprot:6606531-Pyramimonas_sp.AAC.1